ncbi:hypothetical protein VTO42DRAFT_6850 [Malbranchea cinnamomea]
MAPKRRAAASDAYAPSKSPASFSMISSTPTPFTDKSTPREIVLGIWQRYILQTPQRILLLDAFMGFLAVVAVVQFIYCILAGNYPFNAFLSGFGAAVGQFVLTASLRMQLSSEQGSKSGPKKTATVDKGSSGVSSERAFADYVFGSVILHFFCINFIN